MASDSSDDELTAICKSSDEVIDHESVGTLSPRNMSGKENNELLDGKAKEKGNKNEDTASKRDTKNVGHKQETESGILETQRQGPYRCRNGLTISLIKGQLAEQKVDVIVCATTPDLNLTRGAAGKSLLERGGQHLQTECKKNYPNKIREGEVVDINGGNLQCAKVYLTVLPEWSKSNNGQVLRDVVVKCLAKAYKDSKSSIAFAAMGTGQLHYPHRNVASLMYDACILFDSKNAQSSMKKVHFVLYDKNKESIMAFEMEEKNRLCGGARPKSSSPSPQEYTVGNVTISQTVGELAIQQKEQVSYGVDVILCSCAEKKVLFRKGACAALLSAGGQTLKDEWRMKYPNGIKHGQIAIIGGGNLKCKHVLLTALPQYADNGGKVLSDVIKSALQMAASKGCKSIAMPAMGSGYLKYPPSLVATVMHDAVGDWVKKNRSSSLTTVKFVLYFKDKSTRDAFQHVGATLSTRNQETMSGMGIILDPSDDSICTVGNMKVKIYAGDIINETTDAIVNSVGSNFSFQDGVSALLKQKCPGLEERCQEKVAKLKKSGVVMTDSFGLKCKKIIHVKFQNTLMGWKRVMIQCLEKANRKSLSSIAFPVLGTDDGKTSFAADRIAEMLFEALIDFDYENTNLHLQQVNIVVYNKQTELIPAIKRGMVKVSCRGPRGAIGRTWDRLRDVGRSLKDMVLPQSGLVKHQETPSFTHSQMSEITTQVYSDSELNIQQCFTNLEKKLGKPHSDCIAKMSPPVFEEFFKTDLLVDCEFKKDEKQVLIRGTAQNVSEAQNVFQSQLQDKAWKENEKEEAERLYETVQWQYEEITSDGKKLIPYDKLINLKIETAFKNGNHRLELPGPSNKTFYIIDLKNYYQYNKDDEDDSVKIVRKDLLKGKKNQD